MKAGSLALVGNAKPLIEVLMVGKGAVHVLRLTRLLTEASLAPNIELDQRQRGEECRISK